MLVPGFAQLRFEKQKRDILDTLRSFQIDAAQCYDPRDRTYILGVIADRWSVRGGVAGFETDVREGPIFHAIEKELGGGALFRYVDACVEINQCVGCHAIEQAPRRWRGDSLETTR